MIRSIRQLFVYFTRFTLEIYSVISLAPWYADLASREKKKEFSVFHRDSGYIDKKWSYLASNKSLLQGHQGSPNFLTRSACNLGLAVDEDQSQFSDPIGLKLELFKGVDPILRT